MKIRDKISKIPYLEYRSKVVLKIAQRPEYTNPALKQKWGMSGAASGKSSYFDLFGFSGSFIITSNKWRNKMSGLKSSWEISMEKSDKLVPEVKKQKKLTAKQKEHIAEIRREFKAKIADKDVTFQHKLNHLAERTPPEQLEMESEKLKQEFAEEKEQLEKEMETQVEAIRKPSQ